MVFWNPLESGPMTASDAERYGLLGTGSAFEESVPGEVRSESEEFDAALDTCNRQIDDLIGVGLAVRFAEWEDLKARIRTEFVRRAVDAAEPVLVLQMRCFSRSMGLNRTLIDPTEVLRSASVDVGRYERRQPRAVRLDRVEIVEVPRSTYRATTEETRAAGKFVECARTTDLEEQLLQRQGPARADVLAKFDHDLGQWHRWAATAAARLDRDDGGE